jgi:hypothetical protein
VRPFRREELVDTPHHLYLAHDTLLALAGRARVEVEFELSQPISEPLDIVWEYWDGKVWRGFLRQRPECAELGAEKLDATNGLTRSGKLRLESECAEAAKTAVNGIEGFWIRGRLDEPLPPDPGQILPEISQLRLATVIERPLGVLLAKATEAYLSPLVSTPALVCALIDGDGRPIQDALIELLETGDLAPTGADGSVTFELRSAAPALYTLKVRLFDATFERPLHYAPVGTTDTQLRVELILQLGGLQPDGAFSDAQELDLTRPFYPFGQQPQPGSTFFVRADEAFSKPGAQVELCVRSTKTPQDSFGVASSGPGAGPETTLEHTITWQYWNGRQWMPLFSFSNAGATNGSAEALTASGEIAFEVPADFAPREVEGKEGYWLRARLVSGAFGFSQEVTWTDATGTTTNGTTNRFTYVIHQPPALSDFRVSYAWTYGPYHAERVLAFNDFAYTDRTEQAKWPGSPFQPYHYLSDTLPALFFGFSNKLPVDRLGLYLDVVENQRVDFAPALEWEYFDGFVWQPLTVVDETRHLRYAGIVSFTGARDAQPTLRFGSERHWLRARQKEDGPPAEPELLAILPNAVWASQWQTTVNETLGMSTGQPRQLFPLRNAPVLEGERIEVRELLGPRAEVEWRSLAAEVLADDPQALARAEELLAREGREPDVEVGALRLRRDRDKRVVEAWVAWRPRPHLRASAADDRHYVLDRGRGLLGFGDGERGRIPPLGADVLAREYRAGGGSTGNVAQGLIEQLLAGIPGVESVSNPRPAEGGADEETLGSVSERGPLTLRHRGRALLAADFEVMTREASPAVGIAKAHPGRDPQGRPRPGWLTITIIPRSDEPRPWPSFGLREKVRRHLEARTDAALAACARLCIVGPDYLAVDVEATIAPINVDATGEVAEAARGTLATFLHPLSGGPEGRGWPLGRDLFLSDVCAALERTPGVDFVSDVQLRVDSTLMGEAVPVPPQRVVAAGELVIRIGGEVG